MDEWMVVGVYEIAFFLIQLGVGIDSCELFRVA